MCPLDNYYLLGSMLRSSLVTPRSHKQFDRTISRSPLGWDSCRPSYIRRYLVANHITVHTVRGGFSMRESSVRRYFRHAAQPHVQTGNSSEGPDIGNHLGILGRPFNYQL